MRCYLGDGLYVRMKGDMVELYTSNGINELDHVFLEPHVLKEFTRYLNSRNAPAADLVEKGQQP